MSTAKVPAFGGSEPPLSPAEMPWRRGKDGEIVINWDYHNSDGVTLRERKSRWEKEFTEEKGAAWVAEAQERLDAEFELTVSMGFLT